MDQFNFDTYPNTDFNKVNLDWMMEQFPDIERRLAALEEGGGSTPAGGEDLFWCTYGSTTIAEIVQAVADGKLPVLAQTGGILVCTSYSTTVGATFSRYLNDRILTIRVSNASVWSSSILEYAKKDSPELTGIPLAPTAPAGTNSPQIATTAFVKQAIASYKKPYYNLPSRALPKYRYIWHDNFHRANTSGTLGTNGDTYAPMTYEYAGAQLVVTDNCCVNTAAAKAQAFADMHYSDCVIEFEADLTQTTLGTRGAGVMFRRTGSSDFWYCQMRTANIKLGKSVSSTITELRNISITSVAVAPIKVSVILNGNAITVCTNGVEVAKIYDDFNINATVHGIYIDNMSSGNNPIIRNFGVKIPVEWENMIDQMDNGTLPYNIRVESAGNSYNFENQTSIVCNSERALRFENRKTDNYRRSEIAISNYGSMLDEQWYTWDILLDNTYNVLDPMSEIIMQMHDIPDDNQSISTQPSFSIFIQNGHYYIHQQYSPYHSTYNTSDITTINTDIGEYLSDVDKWVHWSLHVKWAYNKFFEPLLEVYKNGELVYSSSLPNVINAARPPYFKIGIYTFNWVEHPDSTVANVRIMYVDNIKPSY